MLHKNWRCLYKCILFIFRSELLQLKHFKYSGQFVLTIRFGIFSHCNNYHFFLSCWSGTTTVLQFPVNCCVRDGRPPQIMTLISLTPVTWPQWPLYKSWNVWVYLWKTLGCFKTFMFILEMIKFIKTLFNMKYINE